MNRSTPKPRRLRPKTYVLAGFAAFALAVIACSSAPKASPDDHLCTPGAYVYCRCEDREEGTKLCNDDGKSFQDCVCDGSQPPPTPTSTDDPDKPGPFEDVDSGPPPEAGAPIIPASCKNKLGVVAGASDDSKTYFGAYNGDGTFKLKSATPGMRSAATLLPVGSSLITTYMGTFSSIIWAKMDSGTWSQDQSVGSAQTASPPAMVAFNGGLRLFYLGVDDHYHMGVYGTAWDDATALAEPSAGIGTLSALSPPGAAAISTSVIMTFAAGGDNSLERTTYSSSWSTVGTFTGVSAYEAQPAMVALEAGGANDLLLVYTDASNFVLKGVTRSAGTHNWGTPAMVDSAAITADTDHESTLVALPGGGAMLLFRASDYTGYYSIWDPATGFATPKELVPGTNPGLASAPAATRGHCGSDVTVAFAKKTDGAVQIMRYSGGQWTGPFDVGGVPKATFVGVGELP